MIDSDKEIGHCTFHRVDEIIMNGATIFVFNVTTFDILNFA